MAKIGDKTRVQSTSSEMSIAAYLATIIRSKASFSKLKSTLYAIKYYHKIGNYVDPCVSTLVTEIFEAGKRLSPKNRNRKEPINVDDLRSLFEYLYKPDDLTKLRLWTMVILMFTAFLRFDEASNIRRDDITFYDDYIDVYLPKSKGDV